MLGIRPHSAMKLVWNCILIHKNYTKMANGNDMGYIIKTV